jgi:hypothetical protein
MTPDPRCCSLAGRDAGPGQTARSRTKSNGVDGDSPCGIRRIHETGRVVPAGMLQVTGKTLSSGIA